jgi:putative cardiolipin synthase
VIPSKGAILDYQYEESLRDLKLEDKFTQGEHNLRALSFYEQVRAGSLPLIWGRADLWYDRPEKIVTGESELMLNLTSLLTNIESSLVIISPYFVPTQTGVKTLLDAVAQGKSITIVTNSLASNDVFAVHGWYAKYRQALLEGGVELWEIKSNAKFKNRWSMIGSNRASLHAKIMFFDNNKFFVGSMNLDPRSIKLNTEMAVIIEQPDYVTRSLEGLPSKLNRYAYKVQVKEGDLVWLDLATGETLDSEPAASMWLKMGAWTAGMLPIEDLL